jgi:cytochrome c oxidase cbb3-type subunit I/II
MRNQLVGAALIGLAAGCGDSGAASPGSGASAADAPGGYGATGPAKPTVDGAVLYRRFCQSCHGDTGQGDGPGALMLTIKPRNFAMGKFKFRSTTGPMPSDDDLARTITRGIPGTEMSAYSTLPVDSRLALAEHVKQLSVGRVPIDDEAESIELGAVGTETIDGKLHALVNWFRYRDAGDPVLVSTPPTPSDELRALGRQLFLDENKGGCAKCHGPDGLGNGPSADELKDDWGFAIKPRNLTADSFKGGSELRDVYLRVVLGIPGTPMPASADNLPTERERWAVVYYVAQLAGIDVGGPR